MATLTQVLRERRKYLRDLRASLREVDTETERLDRFLKRVINRKKAFIDEHDYERTTQLFLTMKVAINAFAKLLSKGFVQ